MQPQQLEINLKKNKIKYKINKNNNEIYLIALNESKNEIQKIERAMLIFSDSCFSRLVKYVCLLALLIRLRTLKILLQIRLFALNLLGAHTMLRAAHAYVW